MMFMVCQFSGEFFLEIEQERFDVLIERRSPVPAADNRHVPAADHDQILHQVRMKTLAQLQQQRFLLGHADLSSKSLYLPKITWYCGAIAAFFRLAKPPERQFCPRRQA